MASTREMQTKDGRIFWQITISRGRSRAAVTRRFYWPQGMTRRKAEKALQQAVVDFEREVAEGKAFSRAERKKLAEAEALQAAQRRSVAAYADIYLHEKRRLVASGKMSPATVESYQAFFDLHILPKIGSCLLAEVTVPQLRELVLSFSENHAQSSTVKLHAILNGLFSAAFRDELIATNPMLKVRRPRSDTTKAKTSSAAKAFSASDVRRIFQCLENEPLFWRCFVRFMADTGARRGEVCGLQWADIDFSTGMVVIRRNLQYTVGSGVIEKAPKNGKERAVDIGPDTVALLQQLQEEQTKVIRSDWVFTRRNSSEPIFPQTPNHWFASFGQRYGIPGFHPHALRHTSATLSLQNGGDISGIAERLGHSDNSVTLRMYVHGNEEGVRRAGDAFRRAIAEATGKSDV